MELYTLIIKVHLVSKILSKICYINYEQDKMK